MTRIGFKQTVETRERMRAAQLRRSRPSFWDRVDRSGGPGACWEWQRARTSLGYGCYAPPGEGRVRRAHHVAYELSVGPIPFGLELDHLCFNPPCVNPAHLEPVTHAENMRRAFARRTHCKRGHPFDEANTYRGLRGRGCRTCGREKARRYRRERREQVAA